MDWLTGKDQATFWMLFLQNQRFIVKFSGSKLKHSTLLPFLSKVLLHIGFWKECVENPRSRTRVVSQLQTLLGPVGPGLILLNMAPPWSSLLGVGVSFELAQPTCLDTLSPLSHPQLSFSLLSWSVFDQFAADSHHLLLSEDFSPNLPTHTFDCPELRVPLWEGPGGHTWWWINAEDVMGRGFSWPSACFLSSSSSQHWSYRPTVAPSATRDPGLQAHRGDASTEAAVSIEAGFHELLHSQGNSEVGAANSTQGS